VDNLQKVLKEISEKSDENDFVYLFLNAHGKVGYTFLRKLITN